MCIYCICGVCMHTANIIYLLSLLRCVCFCRLVCLRLCVSHPWRIQYIRQPHQKPLHTADIYIYIYIHSCSTSHSTTQHAGDSGNRVLNSVCSFSENDATNIALGMTGIAMQAASTPVDASSKNARQCVELTFPARSQTLLMVLQICGKL